MCLSSASYPRVEDYVLLFLNADHNPVSYPNLWPKVIGSLSLGVYALKDESTATVSSNLTHYTCVIQNACWS